MPSKLFLLQILLVTSGSPLTTATAELSLLDIASARKPKHLSDDHDVLDVGEWGFLAAALPLGVTKDSNDITKNGTI